MKKVSLVVVLVFTIGILARGQSETIAAVTNQLQKTPTDAALREKIIKLAATVKPALPEEAERRIARGVAAFEGAKSVADYQDAIKEFQAAVDAAPWYGPAYFKLGFTQDKAERYADALQSLKWAQMASPDAKDIKTLIYEVEYRNEKYNSPEAKTAREKAASEATGLKTQSDLIGNWKVYVNGQPQRAGGPSEGGGNYSAEFHYRFENRGSEIAVYLITDSDPDFVPNHPTWCRRNGGGWACKGDEDLYAKITLDGKAIHGKFLYFNYNTEITGSVNGTEVSWTLIGIDKQGRVTQTIRETMRKY